MRLDDILNELAMIRRVQEDARLVCMDVYYDTTLDNLTSNSWAERGRSKVKRLENDASRVRQAVSHSKHRCFKSWHEN